MDFKRIDFENARFEANGKVYHIVPHQLTPIRFKHWQTMSIELSYGQTFQQLIKQDNELERTLTSGNDLLGAHRKAIEIVLSRKAAMRDIRKSEDKYMKFCTLFCNTENEDLTRYDEQLIQSKLDDWYTEPFDINDFFLLATNQVPGLVKSLQENSK